MSPAAAGGRGGGRAKGGQGGGGGTQRSGGRAGGGRPAPSGRGQSGGRPATSGRATAGRGRPSGGRTTGRGGEGQGPARGASAPRTGLGGDQVEGRQAVRELLRANRRRVKSLMLAEGMDAAPVLDEIERLAATRRVRVELVSRRRIDQVARTEGPQGVVALAAPVEETPLETLCRPSGRGRPPFLLVLDGITDPHNLGALLRSAECAGVTGVILPKHRSAHLSPTVTKVAAGAIEYLRMALVAGVPSALQRMTALGIWSVGLDGDAPGSFYDLPLESEPVALVLGSEGEGLSALARKRCDALAAIPQHGTLPSLNVATAGAIACFDIARRRG